MAPVEIDLLPTDVLIRPTGWHRLWSMRRLTMPYGQITSVSYEPELVCNGPFGIRFPGTDLPGVYIAGTYRKSWSPPRIRSFWVRRHAEQTIMFQLHDHWFDLTCVEVDDLELQGERLRHAINEPCQQFSNQPTL